VIRPAETARAGVVGGVVLFSRLLRNRIPPCRQRRSSDICGRSRPTPDRPIYYLGDDFDGLPLTAVLREADLTTFLYGTCKIPPFSDTGCAPPVQVQTHRFDPDAWAMVAGCRRLGSLRGVPTVDLSGLTLFTADVMVKIDIVASDEEKRKQRAVEALRTVSDGARARGPLPPPPNDIRPLIDKGCGARPGEHGPTGPA